MKAKFDIENDDPITDDAGDSFGGQKEKKKAKKRKTNHDSDEELLAPLPWFLINLWDWLLYFIRDRGGSMKPRRKICDFTTSCQIIAMVKSNGTTSRSEKIQG